MLDVHPPHERMHGFKDFLLHLFTITIGLLIALSVEGCMERQHERHLVRDAEAGLRSEIAHNSNMIASLRQQISEQQNVLNTNLTTLAQMATQPAGVHTEMSFSFHFGIFDDVAWKTAQTTGAFSYMPYADAKSYSEIYSTQDEVFLAEKQVVDEVLNAASFPSTQSDDWRPTPAQAEALTTDIGRLRMRLLLLSSLVDSLDHAYHASRSEHP